MGLVITIIEGGVNIEDTDADQINSFPVGTTSLVYNNSQITSKSVISAKIKITSVSAVDSISDDKAGGVGNIPVPGNVKALWAVLNPFFLN